jgi:ribonucleoside-diphosphate reductase beta chain
MNECLDKIGFEKPFDVPQNIIEATNWMEEEVYASAMTDFFVKKPIDYAKKMKSFNEDELF